MADSPLIEQASAFVTGSDATGLHRALGPVRHRQWLALIAETTAWGILAGAGAGLMLAAVQWATAAEASLAAVLGTILAGMATGVLVGVCWRRGWTASARAVDRHYGLKDRALSALAFTEAGATDAVS